MQSLNAGHRDISDFIAFIAPLIQEYSKLLN